MPNKIAPARGSAHHTSNTLSCLSLVILADLDPQRDLPATLQQAVIAVELGGGPIGTLDVYASDPAAGTLPRSPPCRPTPGARSSGRKLSEVAREVADGQPLPRRRTRPTSTPAEQPRSDAGDPQQGAS
jgi:hypothetical protein